MNIRRRQMLAAAGDRLATLPWCLRVLLENALRTSAPEGAEAAIEFMPLANCSSIIA